MSPKHTDLVSSRKLLTFEGKREASLFKGTDVLLYSTKQVNCGFVLFFEPNIRKH